MLDEANQLVQLSLGKTVPTRQDLRVTTYFLTQRRRRYKVGKCLLKVNEHRDPLHSFVRQLRSQERAYARVLQ